ncbi:hypothetical protein PYW07_013720 [Mythimna separata]|uniref:10 kDa heat shock protein, mitochondrial n=1 Tax=Mythimna separata TaxID=271217 RepID=A0AAD7YF82_MYTSE|nr:hypothetical protein PYW07_013720 [Mythimna separata]
MNYCPNCTVAGRFVELEYSRLESVCEEASEPISSFVSVQFLTADNMSNIVKQLIPLLDRVLIRRAEAITKTAGGIVIPEKAQGKVLHGEVVAVGPGARKDNGDFIPILVKVGDKVLLPEYGGTKVSLENDEKEYHLFRESDILAKIDN